MSTITTKEKDDQINEMEIRIEELESRLQIDTLNPNRRHHITKLAGRIEQLEAKQINYDRILVLAARWCNVKHDDWQEILLIATGEN
jgi:BMFP domain-containing protein YqiC